MLYMNSHEIHASHQQDKVDQKKPMPLESNLALLDESLPNIVTSSPNTLTLDIRVSLWQAQSKDDEEDRGTRAEPKERPPSMGSSVDQRAGKDSREQVPKSISLLQHTRNDSPSPFRAVFQRCGCRITVQTSHCDTEKCADREEFVVGLAEACSEFQDDEKDVVDYERPFAAVSVCCNSESDGTDGAEHQHQSDAPCDVCFRFIERFG
jgi:hypothetical protein